MKSKIRKMREYLNYIETHYDNVQKAWGIIQDKCGDFDEIKDLKEDIDYLIANHDASKLDSEEFEAYRVFFHPTEEEIKFCKALHNASPKEVYSAMFQQAWDRHKKLNGHHWQTWTQDCYDDYFTHAYVIEMICDWMAMGMVFGNNAQQYYEFNKDDIKIPADKEAFMYRIFNAVYA